jgi:hypothetical protein
MVDVPQSSNEGGPPRPRSPENSAFEREPLIASRPTHELDEYPDGALPYHVTEVPTGNTAGKNVLGFLRSKRGHLRSLLLLVLGIFLASCPIPRMHLAYPLRILLITFDASLVTFETPRRGVVSRRERVLRTLTAYFGYYLSMYSIFGASDEIHMNLQWQALFWYPTYKGFHLGYITRWILIFCGYRIQISARLHSRSRIISAYLLSLLLVYIDMPTTIFDLARGRQHW